MIDILCADVKSTNFQHLPSSISYHHYYHTKYAYTFSDDPASHCSWSRTFSFSLSKYLFHHGNIAFGPLNCLQKGLLPLLLHLSILEDCLFLGYSVLLGFRRALQRKTEHFLYKIRRHMNCQFVLWRQIKGFVF